MSANTSLTNADHDPAATIGIAMSTSTATNAPPTGASARPSGPRASADTPRVVIQIDAHAAASMSSPMLGFDANDSPHAAPAPASTHERVVVGALASSRSIHASSTRSATMPNSTATDEYTLIHSLAGAPPRTPRRR